MDKSIAGIIGVVATASIVTPVAFISVKGNINEERIYEWGGVKIPKLTASSDIKNKYKEVDCLKDLGGSVEWSSKVQSGVPGENFMQNEETSNSCLIVEYYKQTVTGNIWRGGFRLVWSVSDNNKSLFTSFNVHTNNGKLVLDSSVYFLEKNGNSWYLKYRTEEIKVNISNEGDLSNYFPESGNLIKNGDEDKYWGFKPNIQNICKGNECYGNAESQTSIVLNWKKDESANSSPIDWSSNFYTWFQKLFPNWYQTPNEFSRLKGTWTKLS